MIFDISIDISPQMIQWEGDSPVKIRQVLDIRRGDAYNLSEMKMSVHTGTHLDAPKHFLADGKFIEDFPLDLLIGEVQVVLISDEIRCITAQVLKAVRIRSDIKRVLFKTHNSQYWKICPHQFQNDFVSLSVDGADYLIQQGIKLVGIDYLSISPADDFKPVHARLMEEDIAIIETLDLSEVEPGIYTLVCLPLKLKGVEGAPVRAVLMRDE